MEKKQVRQEVMERKEPIVSPLGEKRVPWPMSNKSKPPCK